MPCAMTKQSFRRQVIMAMAVGTASRREILSGIFNFANERNDWGLKLFGNETELFAAELDAILKNKPDGMILSRITDTALIKRIAKSGIPTVILETGSPGLPVSSGKVRFLDITKSSIQLGRFGAQYLLKNGSFRHFAFVPSAQDTPWSRLREKGFCSEIVKARKPVSVFPQNREYSSGAQPSLADWLKALPKPAAVMVAHDIRAPEVIDACTSANISIPEIVNVLSVDNDNLICENAKPSISSIKPAHAELGYALAQKLDALMRNLKSAQGNVANPSEPLQIVERRSTRIPIPAAHLVENALAYIEENALRGITAQDVATHLGISRPLLYLRFKELHSESVGATIERTKLGAAQKLLRQTQLPIDVIAQKTGFANRPTFTRLMKQRTGKTPAEFRRAAQPEKSA